MKVKDENIQRAVKLLDEVEIKGLDNMQKILKAVAYFTTAEEEKEEDNGNK